MENIQDILVYLIIGIAVLVAGYSLVRTLTGKKSGCDGCVSDCSGCSVIELKKKMDEAKSLKEQQQTSE